MSMNAINVSGTLVAAVVRNKSGENLQILTPTERSWVPALPPKSKITAVTFESENKILCATSDRWIRSVVVGEETSEWIDIVETDNPVVAIQVPVGSQNFTFNDGSATYVFDAESQECSQILDGFSSHVSMTPSGKYVGVLVGSDLFLARRGHRETGTPLTKNVISFAFASNKQLVVLTSTTVSIWNVINRNMTNQISLSAEAGVATTSSFSLLVKGGFAFISTSQQGILVVDITNGTVVTALNSPSGVQISALAVIDRTIILWESGSCRWTKIQCNEAWGVDSDDVATEHNPLPRVLASSHPETFLSDAAHSNESVLLWVGALSWTECLSLARACDALVKSKSWAHLSSGVQWGRAILATHANQSLHQSRQLREAFGESLQFVTSYSECGIDRKLRHLQGILDASSVPQAEEEKSLKELLAEESHTPRQKKRGSELKN